jgi:hypothetical protein
MILLLVTVLSTLYVSLVTWAFVAAAQHRQARGLLLTLGVLGVLAPLAVLLCGFWAVVRSPMHIG